MVIGRARRRFLRFPLIKELSWVVEERRKEFLFRTQTKDKQRKNGCFARCSTLEEFFEFSSKEFGPHQIKSEIISFLEFAKNESPKYVCEIGTADGGTNFLLSQALPSVRLMVGIDLFVRNQFKLCYFSKPSQEIEFVSGSSYEQNTVDKVKQILGDRKLDLLFIDGDHHYEGVKQDFLKYRHFVREEGIIVFHDIVPDYLTRYGTKTNRWVGGVPKFWDEIKCFYSCYEFVEDSAQDGLGIGAIRYSSQVIFPNVEN
ncbi:MAG: class I SAM-dependent methyltransferase [Trichocoleus desertorum ATA4-8-CV12]|nr:class I SAM-dependent methyltransferase [Trichocoleus desertorum ATA4-8-CV12]